MGNDPLVINYSVKHEFSHPKTIVSPIPSFLIDQYKLVQPWFSTKQFGSDSKSPNVNLNQTVFHNTNVHMDEKRPIGNYLYFKA